VCENWNGELIHIGKNSTAALGDTIYRMKHEMILRQKNYKVFLLILIQADKENAVVFGRYMMLLQLSTLCDAATAQYVM